MKNRGVRRAWWVVAAAVFAATPHLRAQAITSNWLNPVGGFWLAASNWSSNPNAPRNGTPAGATYDAMVNLAGTYTISGAPSSFTLHSLTLNNANATLDFSNTTSFSATSGITLTAGNLRLFELQNTAVTGSGNIFTNNSATLQNDTFSGVTISTVPTTSTFSMTLFARDSLTLNNAILSIKASEVATSTETRSLNFSDNTTFTGTGGQVVFDGNDNATTKTLLPGANFSIGVGLTLRTGTGSGTIGQLTKSITNSGAISAQTLDRTLIAYNVTNKGTVEAKNGSSLWLPGTFTNPTGTIAVNNGTLYLGGTDTITSLGSFSRTGGTVNFIGTLNNAGKTLDLSNTAAGAINLADHATISGGTLTASGAATPLILPIGNVGGSSAGVKLDGVTLNTDLTITAGSTLISTTALTIGPGKTIRLTGSGTKAARLLVSSTETLSGGTIIFDADPAATSTDSIDETNVNPMTLTLSPTTTVRTGTSGGTIGNSAHSFANQGAIIAQTAGKTLKLDGAWSNTGTIRADAGTLQLDGTFTRSGMGNIIRNPAAAVSITGDMTNTAETFDTDAFGGITIGGFGGIRGGAVIGSAARPITLPTRENGYLSATTLTGEAFAASGSTLEIDDGMTFTGGATLRLRGARATLNSQFYINIDEALSGSGQIVAEGDSAGKTNAIAYNTNGGTLTIGPDITIRTALGTASSAKLSITGHALVNNGLISSDVAPLPPSPTDPFFDQQGEIIVSADTSLVNNATIRGINGGRVHVTNVINHGTIISDGGRLTLESVQSNDGTISASNAEVIFLGNYTPAILSHFSRTNSTVEFAGSMDNTGNTFDFGLFGPATLGGTVTGGRVVSTAANMLTLAATLSNTTLSGPVTTSQSGSTISAQHLTLDNATIYLQDYSIFNVKSAYSHFTSEDSVGGDTVLGNGTISFEGISDLSTVEPAFLQGRMLTLSPGITVQTGTAGGFVGAGGISGFSPATMILQGHLAAITPGKTITLLGFFTNQGKVEAQNGGTVVEGISAQAITNLASNTLTGGTWVAGANSTLDFHGGTFATLAANVTLDGTGSLFAAIAPLTSITSTGAFAIDHGRNFSTVASLANAGLLRVGSGSTLTVNGTLTNTGTIKGKGTIVGNIDNSGTIAPGESPGTLNITGDLALSSAGVLEIEIGGTTPGVDYDVLNVSGTLTLAGTLKLTLVNGYVPGPNDVFDFMNFAHVSGQFASVQLPPLPPNVTWDVQSLQTGGPTATPEPSALALITIAALATRRRRRTR